MQQLIIWPSLAAILTLTAATPSWAQNSAGEGREETSFLRSFEGRFTGKGRLDRASGSSHALNCSFDGDHSGAQVVLNGNCSTAILFNTAVRIELRYDPATGRYGGAFRESRGTVADLTGARLGQTLSLAFNETAESVRPGPPARLTISRKGDDMMLMLRSIRPGQGQNLDLMLRESR